MNALARDYATDVPSPALAALSQGVEHVPNEFLVPVEVCLALTTSVMANVIRDRRARGIPAKPLAKLFRQHGDLYARVEFYGTENQALFFHLDQVQLWENRAP